MGIQYVQVCTNCKELLRSEKKTGDYICPKCKKKLLSVKLTVDEWESLSEKERIEVVKKEAINDASMESIIRSPIKAILRFLIPPLSLIAAIIILKLVLGHYNNIVAYDAWGQLFPLGWLTVTQDTPIKTDNSQPLQIGSSVELSNNVGMEMRITITGDGLEYDEIEGTLYAVYFEVENIGDKDIVISSTEFEFYADNTLQKNVFVNDDNYLYVKTISPGRKAVGAAYTDANPDNYDSFEVEFYDQILKIK